MGERASWEQFPGFHFMFYCNINAHQTNPVAMRAWPHGRVVSFYSLPNRGFQNIPYGNLKKNRIAFQNATSVSGFAVKGRH